MGFRYSLESFDESSELKKAKAILGEVSKFKVSNNCQKFAVALELKFRGITKEPTMNFWFY